ncbi:SGNH/GDSL hydrolase family protein [uncultured Pontibacter sp.]|uniref:SGNH/GDSL hydrolase family protein n=1 Tax=uncultured Pontibacter sp. TaxID=453356 RepID=UPI0026301C14|nr:SGNH/GDSL hydrolase family protein [uncultured Pontibacter sp.]
MLSTDIAIAQDWAQLGKYKAENAKLKTPAPGEKRVVFMGNSITEGWSNHYPAFFKGKPYVNRGISGQTTPQMLLRFRQDVVELKPAIVVILAGINDIAGNTGPATLQQIEANIIAMAELAEANNINVVLSSVLPALDFGWNPGQEPASKVIALNKLIRKYADQHKLPYIDYYSAMADAQQGLKQAYTYDGVHPNEAGYKIMAPLAEAAIAKALAQE